MTYKPLLVVAALQFLLPPPAHPQATTYGRLTGVVRDVEGGVLPGVSGYADMSAYCRVQTVSPACGAIAIQAMARWESACNVVFGFVPTGWPPRAGWW